MDNKYYNPFIYPSIMYESLDITSLKKPHLWEVEIWRYHVKIDGIKSKNKKEIQKWIKNKAYDIMYKNGDCMIYIKVNGIRLTYWAFMKNKYYLD